MQVGETFRIKNDPEIGSNFASTMDLFHEYEIDFNTIKAGITAYVLQEHLAEDYYEGAKQYVVPHSWWDMFKETYATRWWMTWFVRKHLPKFDTHWLKVRVKVDRYANYPQANVHFEALGRVYPYEKLTRLDVSDEA